jgi:hypothetical protein
MRVIPLVILFALFGQVTALAKVAGLSFEELVRMCDAIVIARVERVSAPLIEKKWAIASITETWKGSPDSKITFLASPTWTCDISNAEKGETVVLFLVKDKDPTRYVLAVSGRGRMPVREVGGKQCVTIWPEVRLPKDTPTIAGPEPQWDFIKSVEVEKLHDLVNAAVGGAK